jgi:hypothetical protein
LFIHVERRSSSSKSMLLLSYYLVLDHVVGVLRRGGMTLVKSTGPRSVFGKSPGSW